MAIFNSYVKLPEGTLKNMVVFHSKLLDSQRHPRISRDSDGTPITNYHDLPMLSGFLQMIYTSQYVYVYIYIHIYICVYIYTLGALGFRRVSWFSLIHMSKIIVSPQLDVDFAHSSFFMNFFFFNPELSFFTVARGVIWRGVFFYWYLQWILTLAWNGTCW